MECIDMSEPNLSREVLEGASALPHTGSFDTKPSAAIDAARSHGSKLSYKIPDDKLEQLISSKNQEYWSHSWYRNVDGLKVEVSYAPNKRASEALAKRFSKKKILGFDMEWKPRWAKTLQQNISLIQLACEDEVALFHIARHPGETPQQILAPSLRKIIEDPHITKTGVAILDADGRRLQQYMELTPRGLFELSHLHRLVEYSTTDLLKVNKSLVGLSKLARHHLGFSLRKGSVRTSDWSKELNNAQKEYAASDAYVAYVLYHVMEAKRLNLNPIPPRPKHAELLLPILLAGGSRVPSTVDSRNADPINAVTQESAMHVNTEMVSARTRKLRSEPAVRVKAVRDHADDFTRLEKAIFKSLCASRNGFARAEGVSPVVIAKKDVLASIARLRPTTTTDLMKVNGIGSVELEKYGAVWLEVVAQHCEGRVVASREIAVGAEEESLESRKQDRESQDSESMAFGRPILRRQVALVSQPALPAPLNFDPFIGGTGQESKPEEVVLDLVSKRLFSAICGLRIRLANITGKPPHEIIKDESITLIAIRKPTTIGEICRIPGAGQLFLLSKAHGQDLLAFIQNHLPQTTKSRDPVAAIRTAAGNKAKRRALADKVVLPNVDTRCPPTGYDTLSTAKKQRTAVESEQIGQACGSFPLTASFGRVRETTSRPS